MTFRAFLAASAALVLACTCAFGQTNGSANSNSNTEKTATKTRVTTPAEKLKPVVIPRLAKPRPIPPPSAPMQQPRFHQISAHHFHIEENQTPNPYVRDRLRLRLRPQQSQTRPAPLTEELIEQFLCAHQFTVDF